MIARISRRLATHAGERDRGITMVELLVSMLITSIALAMIGTLFVTVAKTTADSNSTRAATGSAANAIDDLGRVIRSAATTASGTDANGNIIVPASAVVAASATSLTVTSYVGGTAAAPAPAQVAFTLDGKAQLVETNTAAVLGANGLWSYSGASTSRTVSGPLVTSGTSLFTYSDAAGNALTPGTTGLSPAQCGQVASVTVTVTVPNPQLANGSSPVVLTSTVGMPNLALKGGGS